jgi:hypothetical protein
LSISYPNAFYHVTYRGNDRRVIFRDDHVIFPNRRIRSAKSCHLF